MASAIGLEGKKINHLTVIERVQDHVTKGRYKKIAYKCRCDCGNEKVIVAESLLTGNTIACGCMGSVGLEKRKTHNMSRTRNYRIWVSMRQRCNNPRNTYYKNYGERGIAVCDEWTKYEPFKEWSFSNGYADDLTLDRIDNEEGYSPDNCRWVSRSEQMRNTRNNHRIEWGGETHTMVEWAEITGLPVYVIRNRLIYGWSIEDALTIRNREVDNYKTYLRGQRI